MTQYSKYNIIYRLQKWIDTVAGQTFLNYGYSWGASIVILGALFKLTHLPGANIWLFLGMGTEVIVFFLSAFDRPFDTMEKKYLFILKRTRKMEKVLRQKHKKQYLQCTNLYLLLILL